MELLDENLLSKLNAPDLVTLLVTVNEPEQLDLLLDWFLFTYSPEKQWDQLQQNAHALKDPRLLHLVVSKVAEQYQPEIFLETVNLLASIENYERAIVDSGILPWVVLSMGRDEENPRSQQLGCKLLACLAINPAIRNYFAACGATKRVIYALQNHQQNPPVLLEVYKALTNIGFRSRVNKDIFIREKVVDTILDVTEMYQSDVRIVNEGLMTLRSIIVHDLLNDQQQHVIVRDVLLKMLDFKDVAEIQVNSLWILVLLFTGSDSMKRHAVNQLGALIHVFRAMENFLDNPYIQLPGVLVLALVSKLSTNRTKIAESGSLGIHILTKAMKKWIDDTDILRAALKSLYRLSFSKYIREELGQNGVIEESVSTMRRHLSNYPIQRSCCLLIHQLSKSPSIAKYIREEPLKSTILDAAENAFGRYPDKEGFPDIVDNIRNIIADKPVKLKIKNPFRSVSGNTDDVRPRKQLLRQIDQEFSASKLTEVPSKSGEGPFKHHPETPPDPAPVQSQEQPPQIDILEKRRQEREERRRRALEEVISPRSPLSPKLETTTPNDVKSPTPNLETTQPNNVKATSPKIERVKTASSPTLEQQKPVEIVRPLSPPLEPKLNNIKATPPKLETKSSEVKPTSPPLEHHQQNEVMANNVKSDSYPKIDIENKASSSPKIETNPSEVKSLRLQLPAIQRTATPLSLPVIPSDSTDSVKSETTSTDAIEDTLERRRREREERRKRIHDSSSTYNSGSTTISKTTETRPVEEDPIMRRRREREERRRANEQAASSSTTTPTPTTEKTGNKQVTNNNKEPEEDEFTRKRREREERRKRMEEERIAEELRLKEEREKRRLEREEQKKKQEEEDKRREEERRIQREEKRRNYSSETTTTSTRKFSQDTESDGYKSTNRINLSIPTQDEPSLLNRRRRKSSEGASLSPRKTEENSEGNSSRKTLDNNTTNDSSYVPRSRRTPDADDALALKAITRTEPETDINRRRIREDTTYQRRTTDTDTSPYRSRNTTATTTTTTEESTLERRRRERAATMEKSETSTDSSPSRRTYASTSDNNSSRTTGSEGTTNTTDDSRERRRKEREERMAALRAEQSAETTSSTRRTTTTSTTTSTEESSLERRRREREERTSALDSTIRPRSNTDTTPLLPRTPSTESSIPSRREVRRTMDTNTTIEDRREARRKREEEAKKEDDEREKRLEERRRRREQIRSGND